MAAFDLAGIPNGTCTSSLGARLWFDPINPLVMFCDVNEDRPSVQESIRINFADIRALGKPGDIVEVTCFRQESSGAPATA